MLCSTVLAGLTSGTRGEGRFKSIPKFSRAEGQAYGIERVLGSPYQKIKDQIMG